MLGRVVRRHLAERGHSVATTDARFRPGTGDDLVEAVVQSGADVVVNCAGAIPSKVSDPEEMFRANAILPQQLGARLGPGQLLIHASSDGVYDGALGPYSRDDAPNAIDTYGLSKRLGELVMHLVPTVVIRTSVVGTGGSLLAWLLEQQGEIDGYTNHRWNGITTLEWARVCADLIDREEPRRSRIEHVTSGDPVTKFDLLQTAIEVSGTCSRRVDLES
jgi:dTDP-4-dehydrorhamnose reductase